MAQQTAVEWLIEQFEGNDSKIARVIGLKEYNSITKQAKQMEKEQIVKAHGLKYYDLNEETISGEQYYNETFTSTPQGENPSATRIGQF
jgi:GTP-dependent phosphoenolpyruvate carboxykinase